jgi:phage-related protein
MANDGRLGASFSIDVTDLKAGLAQANRMIRESESEFKAAAAGMDDWRESQDGLNAKIKSLNSITDVQKKKVNALQAEYDRLIASGIDPTSKAAVELRTKINNETAALNKNETELKQQKKALEDLGKETQETAEEVENMGSSFEGLKNAGSIAVGALAAVGAACVAAVGAFLGLAESTRETQLAWAKLEASFDSAGHELDNAVDTVFALQGVLGDTDRAVEASNFLAKVSKDEKDLAANTRILTGVFAEYGESIPTEGLAEGIAATAEMGSVQGVLADALEWQGVNLDDFNAKLGEMSTAEERAAYTQKVLTDIYGESADAYREANSALIESNEAQLRLDTALADIGAIALPIMTELKNIASNLLMTIRPFVELIGEGLSGALNGTAGSADKLAEGLGGLISTALDKIVALAPFLIETILSIIPKLLDEIVAQLPSILQMLSGLILSVAGKLETLLPTILVCIMQMVDQITRAVGDLLPVLIPLVIRTVIMLVETLLDNIDLLIDSGIELLMGLADGIIMAIPQLLDKIPVIINKLVAAIVSNLPKLIAMGAELLAKLAMGIVGYTPRLVAQIPQIILAIVGGFVKGISKIKDTGKDIVRGLWEGISDMGSWIAKKIKGFGENVLGGIKDFFGIHSPSQVMADEVGKNLALGIGEGFTDNIAGVNKQITGAMNIGGVGTVGTVGGRTGGGAVVNQYNYYSQAHSRIELYKTKQATAAAVRLAMTGA